MFIKKFYDVATADTAGATTAIETPSIATLMAKGGVYHSDPFLPSQVVENIQYGEQKTETVEEIKTEQEPAQAEPTPAAPATEATATAQVESPATTELKFGEKAPIEQQPQVTEKTWQEVLKSQQPDAVLKELGFDDKVVNFLNHWKNNGDVKPYLTALSVDYAKMSPEDVMRHQLRKDYPKASDKAIELLYRQEVVDAFKIDPEIYTDEEVENGRLLLEAKAERHREQLSADNEKYFIPQAPAKSPDAPDTQALEAQEQAKKRTDLYVSTMSNDAFTQSVLRDKKITLGEGESKFTYPVDTDALTDILLDADKYQEAIYEKPDANGQRKPIPTKHWLIAAVAKYGQDFLDEYAKHYQSIGAKKTIEPIENAQQKGNSIASKSEQAPQSAAAAMAKGGRLVG